ncbi:DUF3603 family protein [Halalkalibacter oceani]|uniref:DUF3603 family protein n=1 Tax=Halalkalibacter oceani TaxID=1653776 RepID=UPI00339A12B1
MSSSNNVISPTSKEFNLTEKQKKNLNKINNKNKINMIGLTRKERALKKLLCDALERIGNKNSLSELRYWYKEWNPKANLHKGYNDATVIKEQLHNEVNKGWSDRHLIFGEMITRNFSDLNKAWRIEVNREEVKK